MIRRGSTAVCVEEELAVGDVLPFTFEDRQYAVYRLEDGYYATAGKCTHAGALLAKGVIFDHEIECPAHQGRFNIKSGKATRTPAHGCLETFAVKVEGGFVWLELPDKLSG